MSQGLNRVYVYVLVFVAGFTTLGVELTASRLLDPWFGNSLIVWASLIGLILLYLSVGYWLGGKFADRSPYLVTLLRLAGLGALGVGLVPALSRPVLRWASAGLADLNAGVLAASLAAVLVLFAIPVTLLGCTGPFAIRLLVEDVRSSGGVAGRVYALSTAGSIMGSFLPVLWLIPVIGTRRTFATLAAALLVVVVIGLARARRPWEALAALAGLALVAWLGLQPVGPIKPVAGLLDETESAFNYVQVVDAGFERQLRLNEGEGIHSVYRADGGPADGIWDYFLLAPAFNPAPANPAQVQRVALVGLAAGTIARLYTEAYGPIPIDGAELDPAIIAAGRRWFDMTEPNLRALALDGRRFLTLNSLGAPEAGDQPQGAEGAPRPAYDVIAVDVYRPPYIPFHMITVEFFDLARSRLSANGVVAVNVGRTHTDYSLVDAVAATMGQVFPSVFIVDEPDQGSELGNSLVVGTRQRATLADFQANLPNFSQPLLSEIASRMAPNARLATPPPGTPIFTDDRAPVEQVVHNLVLRQMLGLAAPEP
jgi:spermidine synthase